ncbi:MAG: exopolysaccharide biosynthesis polyprenyl glycosylphosphotransferase [Alphaproteobacteria bacterium]|nr:exopolysaccharide biosynthesis polyprenyl glycosylphosphotransferase [Alphaproteobacteria bacterium]
MARRQVYWKILLILTMPLMALIGMLIKLDSSGPVIFQQQRLGYNNRVFNVYKFRTMHVSAEPGVIQATRNDPRITRLGQYLRRLSLDELPQLVNVLRGEMSLVGPRPHAIEHNFAFASEIDEYFARHNLKPGITGWAQIHGLRGEVDTPDKIRARTEHDIYYVDHWSLWLDLRILAMTLRVIWFHQTAY